MGGRRKRKPNEGAAQEPPSKETKRAPHASGHNLSQRRSNVTNDWDKHLGPAISHFSSLHLPTVRAILQRYRYLRTESPVSSNKTIALSITKEVIELWSKAWIPHIDELGTYKSVRKQMDVWANSSRRQENRSKPEFQASLDQLLDIRPAKLRSLEALEKYLKSSRNEDWESDLAFFKGQMMVSLPYKWINNDFPFLPCNILKKCEENYS